MHDAPARHAAAHLDALEFQPLDFGNELSLLSARDEVRVIEKPCGYKRSKQGILVGSRHEIY
jgi:hypothetical protein